MAMNGIGALGGVLVTINVASAGFNGAFLAGDLAEGDSHGATNDALFMAAGISSAAGLATHGPVGGALVVAGAALTGAGLLTL